MDSNRTTDELTKSLSELDQIEMEHRLKNNIDANLSILKTSLENSQANKQIETIYYLMANFHDRLNRLEKRN